MAVVLAVGARFIGQASLSTAASRWTSDSARERRLRAAGDRDHLRAAPLDEGQDAQDLVGLAGVGDGDHHVAGGDHAEVAVARFAGVHEERGRARRGQGGGDLAADVARLPHAGHDDAARGSRGSCRPPRRRNRRGGR